MRYPDLKRYIIASWGKAVTEKKDGNLVLPYSFVPPCIDGHFRVLFYWDTYFTNLGLIIDGKTDLAKNNVENLFFGIDKFGCVPNYLREDGAKWCSQPPLLTLMVQDIFSATNDEKWLEKAVSFIEKEYSFWMSKRITPIGLNQYGSNEKEVDDLVGYYNYVSENRISLPNLSDKEKAKKAIDFISEAESGEDFTPRYDDHRASEYVQIDLNAHLYGVERFLTDYYADKDGVKRALYQKASEKRLFLINKYCYDEKTSLYFDYNYVIEKLNNKICAACFLPFFYGIPENGRELSTIYAKLKTNGGVVACEDTGEYVYQWGYPNIWAPHQYFSYVALKKYGFNEFAEDLAQNYMALLEKEFKKTGKIWERYDKDGVAKALEYETQPMLGWTAGVYNYFYFQKFKH